MKINYSDLQSANATQQIGIMFTIRGVTSAGKSSEEVNTLSRRMLMSSLGSVIVKDVETEYESFADDRAVQDDIINSLLQAAIMMQLINDAQLTFYKNKKLIEMRLQLQKYLSQKRAKEIRSRQRAAKRNAAIARISKELLKYLLEKMTEHYISLKSIQQQMHSLNDSIDQQELLKSLKESKIREGSIIAANDLIENGVFAKGDPSRSDAEHAQMVVKIVNDFVNARYKQRKAVGKIKRLRSEQAKLLEQLKLEQGGGQLGQIGQDNYFAKRFVGAAFGTKDITRDPRYRAYELEIQSLEAIVSMKEENMIDSFSKDILILKGRSLTEQEKSEAALLLGKFAEPHIDELMIIHDTKWEKRLRKKQLKDNAKKIVDTSGALFSSMKTLSEHPALYESSLTTLPDDWNTLLADISKTAEVGAPKPLSPKISEERVPQRPTPRTAR